MLLCDVRTDPGTMRGHQVVDVQDSTYLTHRTTLSYSNLWSVGRDVEGINQPEGEVFVCVGASVAIRPHCSFF